MTKTIGIFATLVMLLSIQTFSADLLYPELHVVPSAEDRLRQAANEEDGFIMRNWQILTPGFMLFASGLTLNGDQDIQATEFSSTEEFDQKKTDIDNMATLQMLAGLGFMGLTYYWDRNNAYASAYKKVQGAKGNSTKQKLIRARIAEESLYKRYKLMKRVRWFVLGAAVGLSQAESDYAGTDAKLVAGLAALSGLLPFVFKHRFEQNYLDYDRYKNRVFGPVVSTGLIRTASNDIVPGLQFSLKF